ncbi:MAG: MFS transporter [Gaiellaceae bacterium]
MQATGTGQIDATEVHGAARGPAASHGASAAGARRTVRRQEIRPVTVVLIASLGMFMAFVDHTVVSVAFPNLLRSFPDAALSSLSWVISAYNIVFAAFLLPAGRVADVLGRRRVFAAGILLFTVASVACALAPTVTTLIAARAVQALGAAIIVPSSLALVLHAFPREQRTKGVGLWSASAALAAGLGPSIGGLLVELSSWRLVFIVNVPVGIVAWRLASTRLVESRAPGARSMPDLLGTLLLVVAIATLAFGLVQSGPWGWTGAGVLASFAVAVAAGWLFTRRSARHHSPVVDLRLLRDRRVAVANALTLVGSVGFYALSLSTVIYLMTVWGYSPLKAGLAMTPAPFAGALAAVLASRWPPRWDVRYLLVSGGLVWTAGAVALVRVVGTEPAFLREWLPIAITLSVGLGLTFPVVAGLAVSRGPTPQFATETGLNAAVRQLGAALGVAMLVVLVGTPARDEVPAAFDRVWVFSALLFTCVAIGSLAIGRVPMPEVLVGELEERERPVEAQPPRRPALPPPPRVAERPTSALEDRVDKQTPADFLRDVSIFSGLDEAVRAQLAENARPVTVTAGAWLFRQGDEADCLYVVRFGRLDVVLEAPGAAAETVRELQRGDVVGELALLSGSIRSASVRARRDCELLRVDRADFEQLLVTSDAFARQLVHVLGGLLERSRGAEPAAPAPPTAIAVIPAAVDAPVERVGELLAGELRRLGPVACLRAGDFEAARSSGEEPTAAVARMLERSERRSGRVLLVATAPEGDDWTDACLRQADRVIVVTGATAPRPGPALTAARDVEVVLCGPPFAGDANDLTDALDPRAAYRVGLNGSLNADVAVIARRLTGRSVGLVLSGGGARALSHIGVIEELVAAGVVIDRVAGASLGAFIAAMVAAGMDADEMDARCYEEWVRRSPLTDYRIPRISLIRGERVRAMLERTLPGRIEELSRPFWCVSSDLLSGELVVHRHGSLATAVGASMCLPGLGPPIVYGNRLLVDGGVLDNLPVTVMAADAEGPIIASKANNSEAFMPDPNEPLEPPLLPETLYRLILLGARDTLEAARRHAAVVVTPDYAGVGMLEFHMLDRMRESGRRAANIALRDAPAEIFG